MIETLTVGSKFIHRMKGYPTVKFKATGGDVMFDVFDIFDVFDVVDMIFP